MLRGKIAVLLAILSLICVYMIGYSTTYDNGIYSLLLNFISDLFKFKDPSPDTEKMIMSVGFFDLNDANIRFFLRFFAMFFAILAGILAIYTSRRDTNSLWYSIAVIIAGIALIKINFISSIIFVSVCFVLIMTFRKWKLSKS